MQGDPPHLRLSRQVIQQLRQLYGGARINMSKTATPGDAPHERVLQVRVGVADLARSGVMTSVAACLNGYLLPCHTMRHLTNARRSHRPRRRTIPTAAPLRRPCTVARCCCATSSPRGARVCLRARGVSAVSLLTGLRTFPLLQDVMSRHRTYVKRTFDKITNDSSLRLHHSPTRFALDSGQQGRREARRRRDGTSQCAAAHAHHQGPSGCSPGKAREQHQVGGR